jgi:hypothetical protein
MALGGGRRSAFVAAALRGAASARDRGEMERGVRGFHPRAHLRLVRLGEAGQLGPARRADELWAAALGAGRGGVRRQVRRWR